MHSRLEKRIGVKSGVWLGLPVGEVVRRRAGDRNERSGRRGGPESEAGVVPLWPGLPVGDWIALLACRFRYLGRPKSCALLRNVVCWAEPLLGAQSMRYPGFMNPIVTPRVLQL